MKLFKNKYKARIEAKIKELEAELQEVISYKQVAKRRIDYDYFVVRQDILQVKITLLKDLLI